MKIDRGLKAIESATVQDVCSMTIKRLNQDAFWITVICVDGKEHSFWVRSSERIRVDHIPDVLIPAPKLSELAR